MSGEVVGRGRFRVDRKLALEKMERFQLEDPHRYVLEWLAAAICGGADGIAITNDSDDFVIEWGGELPSRDELESLLDHVFGHPDDARGQMLQHLGVGVLGALGLGPRWLRLDRGPKAQDGALRLEVVDPAETPAKPLESDAPGGMRCHVRERLGQATMAEALMLPFRDPVEARLVAGAAVWCPVPVRINGRLLPRRGAPDGAIVGLEVEEEGRRGQLWMLPPGVEGTVDVVRHGVVVGHLPLVVPDPPSLWRASFQVSGWFRDDRLKLNASRSAIVEDARWDACRKALDRALIRLLQEALPAADGSEDVLSWRNGIGMTWSASRAELVESARRAALHVLGPRGAALGGLLDVPLLEDVTGATWTPRQLRASKPPPAVSEVADPELLPGDRAVFTGDMAALLRAIVPGTADVTEEMRTRAEGRDRRVKALALRSEPWFDNEPVQRRFARGDLRGAVRLRYPGAGGRGELRVLVRVGGLPIEIVERDGPAGALEGIVDDAGFTPDLGFRRVARDGRFTEALDALHAEAEAFVVDRIRALRLDPIALVLLTSFLYGRWKDRAGGVDELADLADVELIPTGSGLRVSMRTLFTATEPWVVVTALPADCPADVGRRVLLLPDEIARRWTGWLGRLGRDGSGLADEIKRARRLAGPRRDARLEVRRSGPDAPVIVDVSGEGVRGELATWPGSGNDSSLELLRDGVPVCHVVFPRDLIGVSGVVDVADLDVNAAHDGIASPGVLDALAKRLEPAVGALVLALCERCIAEGLPVPDRAIEWLTAGQRSRSAAFRELALVPTPSGARVSLADLIARAPDKRSKKIVMLPEMPPPSLDFDEAVVVTPALRKLLLEVLGPRVRDGRDEIARAKVALDRYLDRPLASPPPRALASIELSEEGWSGTFLLPADPATIGVTTIQAIWRDRVLATRTGGLGLAAHVRGEAFLPDRAFTSVRDGKLLTALKERASDLFPDLVERAITSAERRRSPGDAPSWLALWTRLRSKTGTSGRREQALRIQELPLVQRVDGAWCTLNEVRAAASSGIAIQRVQADVSVGATDHPWYLLDQTGLADALRELLDRPVPDGTEALREWRAGQERRERLVRRSPRVQSTTLRRVALEADGHRGEVGLLGVDWGDDGLRIEPLVDSLPLDPVVFELPAPAVAVVEGAGVRADRAFRAVVRSREWDRLVERIREQVNALADATIAAALEGDAAATRWAVRYLVQGGGDEAQRATPLFPVAGGGRTSIAEIAAREVVGYVQGPAPAFVAGPQPVIADDALVTLLARRFRAVDLTHVAHRHAAPARPPRIRLEAEVALASPRGGQIGFAPADEGIEVRIRGVPVAKIRAAAAGLPLAGWVDDPALTPRPTWSGVIENAASAALDRVIVEAGARVAARLARAEPQAAAMERFGPWLVRWLMHAAPDRDALLAAVDGSAASPELATVAAAPLFVDSTGRRGSLRTVVASTPIRAVPTRSSGRPAPGSPPFWRLDGDHRRWLGKAWDVADAEAQLAIEEQGHVRRSRGPHPKRVPWRMSGELRATLPNESLLSLLPPAHGDTVALLVDGVQIGTYELGVPGLVGWIDGPFATDPAFTEATVDDRTRRLVHEAVVRLLTRERAADPAATIARFAAARGRSVLAGAPLGAVWDDVGVFQDREGKPVSFGQLVREIEKQDAIVYTPLPPGPAVKPLVLAVSANEERWLARLFPDVPRVRSEQLAAAAAATRRKEEPVQRGRALEMVRGLAGPWPGHDKEALDAVLKRWEASPPAVMALAAADPRGPAAALAAWVVGTEAYAEGASAAQEVAFVGRIADELAERVRRR